MTKVTKRLSVIGGFDLKLHVIALGILAVVSVVKSAFAADASSPSPASISIDPAKIVDLTYPFDASTIYWPTEHPFVHEFEHAGIEEPGGYYYSAAKYTAPEHGGT